jgi:hypothetical protein
MESLPQSSFDLGAVYAEFGYDRLDSAYFPRHGQALRIGWRGERRSGFFALLSPTVPGLCWITSQAGGTAGWWASADKLVSAGEVAKKGER